MSGHIICLQADGKAFVLDTAFRRDNKLTDNFAAYRFDLLKPFRDTVFLATSRQVFVLGNDLSLHLLSKPPFDDSLGFPYFGDSRYRVYACSVGEFGAAVRFLDAKTGQLYAYPATNPQQVFFFHGEYVVSSYLAHMEGFSDYLFIKDPGKLYPTRKQTACNWFIDTAMHIKIPPAGQANPAGVRYYEDSFISRTLACFPLGDSLYSIYSTDSATVLARFSGQHLVAT
ncbi:MAG TPA: hypothetical protein VHC50_05235, partial [Puia sp.]|nr:hypothetical protein [Puia sp.]